MRNTSKVVIRIIGGALSFLFLVLVVLGLIRAGQWAYGFGYRVYTEGAVASAPGTDKSVTVTSDMSAKEIGDLLEEKGLIRDAGLFVVQLKLSSYSGQIRSGTYTLNTSMTAEEMMQVMAAEEDTESTENT
mgnify:FL=1